MLIDAHIFECVDELLWIRALIDLSFVKVRDSGRYSEKSVTASTNLHSSAEIDCLEGQPSVNFVRLDYDKLVLLSLMTSEQISQPSFKAIYY